MQTGNTTLSGNFPCLISKESPCFLPLSHFLTTPPKMAPSQTQYPGKRPMVRTDLKQVTFHSSKKGSCIGDFCDPAMACGLGGPIQSNPLHLLGELIGSSPPSSHASGTHSPKDSQPPKLHKTPPHNPGESGLSLPPPGSLRKLLTSQRCQLATSLPRGSPLAPLHLQTQASRQASSSSLGVSNQQSHQAGWWGTRPGVSTSVQFSCNGKLLCTKLECYSSFQRPSPAPPRPSQPSDQRDSARWKVEGG